MDDKIRIWIADYLAGKISREDFTHLKKWIESSSENRREFEAQERLVRSYRVDRYLNNWDEEQSWRRMKNQFVSKKGRNQVYRLWNRWTAVAACISLVVGIAVFYSNNRKQEPVRVALTEDVWPGSSQAKLKMADGREILLKDEVTFFEEKDGTALNIKEGNVLVYSQTKGEEAPIWHSLEVPNGGEYSLQLADGSRVWLNSASSLSYPTYFTGDERRVTVSGEAFFEVTKDAKHPFVVNIGEVSITVLGTSFNICSYPEDKVVVTTLNEGKIRLTARGQKLELLPDKQAIFNKESGDIKVKNVDASMYSAWLKGVFEFENLSLDVLTRQLARWYDVNFVFTDSELASRRFTGGIRKYNCLSVSLGYISGTTNVDFEIVGTTVYVRKMEKKKQR